jgi:hypothetical protein
VTDPIPPRERDEQQDEKWYEKTRYQILLFVVGTALFVFVLGLILDLYIGPKNSTQKKDLVQALGLITAGVAAAVGIYFTWRSQGLSRQAQEENQRLTEQGQFTERFTSAIDQLGATDDDGNKRLEIRLGGIYALERIARDSPKRDYSPVMEVLAAYVRNNASWPSKEPSTAPKAKEFAVQDKGTKTEDEVNTQRPAADILAVVAVLSREKDYVSEEDRIPHDLRRTNLYSVNLRGVYLRGANFQGANLGGAHLQKANLRGADLQGADLQRALLQGADLREKADLREANLVGANLTGANLTGANLTGANLTGAESLTQEQLQQASGDEDTKLLEGLERPKSWTQDEDKQAVENE